MEYNKSKQKREHIIYSAIDVIYDLGMEKTSLNKILNYAEVSKGSFYHQFKSLDELLAAVFKEVVGHYFKELALSPTEMTIEMLKKIGRKIILPEKSQCKMSALLFLMISRSFSDQKIKNQLIKMRQEMVDNKQTDEVVNDQFVLLYDILLIGFLAQAQVVDDKEELINLWDLLAKQILK